MAQLVARLVRIEEVRGSNPLSSTNSVLLKLTDQVGAERPRLVLFAEVVGERTAFGQTCEGR